MLSSFIPNFILAIFVLTAIYTLLSRSHLALFAMFVEILLALAVRFYF